MKKENTLSIPEYISNNVLFTMSGFVLFMMFACDMTIAGKTKSQSLLIMCIIVGVLVIAGMLLTIKKRRNRTSVLLNILLPFEVYTIIANAGRSKVLYIVLAVMIVLVSAAYIYMISSAPMPENRDPRTVKKKRLVRGAFGVRAIAVVLSVTALIPACISNTFGHRVKAEEMASSGTISDDDEEFTVKNQIDTVSNILPERWKLLTEEEKLFTLQTVANIETRYLGLPHPLNVTICNLAEGMLGCYNDDPDHTIKLNVGILDDPEASLGTICHECFHAYQHRIVQARNSVSEEYRDLMAFKNADIYSYEFQNYVSGFENYEIYAAQTVEVTARAYSEEAVRDYYNKVYGYLNLSDPAT